MKKLLFFIALLFTAGAIAAQPAVTGNARIRVSQGNDAWITSLDNLLLGRVGPDSTFLKYNGSYANKRFGDNRYTYGTMSLRDRDTFGILTIRESRTQPLKPSLYFKGQSNTAGDSVDIFFMSQSSDATHPPFIFGAINSGNISSAGKNVSYFLARNLYPGGGRPNTSETGMGFVMESDFINTIRRLGPTHTDEVHIIFTPDSLNTVPNTANAQARLISWAPDQRGRATNFSMFADEIYISRLGGSAGLNCFQTAKTSTWVLADFYAKTWEWGDTLTVLYNKPQVGIPLMRFRAADDSRYYKAFEPDATDRLVMVPEGNSLSVYGNIEFPTKKSITTDDASEVEIGNATKKSFLSIYAPSTQVLQLRSNTGGASLWNTFVNSNNITWARPDGSSYIQAYTDASTLIMSNSRWGFGTTPGARMHIRQDGNGAGNGIEMSNSDASFNAYRALDASGDEIWYNSSGTAKIKIRQAGDFELRAASPLKFYDSDNSNTVTISPPSAGSLTANYTLTLPTDDGTTNQVLTTDGSGALSWTTPSGSGTVTSVALTMPTGFSVSGSPVTSTGTLAVTTTLNGVVKGNGSAFTASAVDLTTEVTGTLPVSSGGTGQATWTSGVIPYGNSASALQSTTNMVYTSGVHLLRNSTTSTTAFNAVSSENYRVQNTDNTAGNWSGIPSYSQGGSIASGIGFQHLNHTSHYDDIAFYTRGSSTGWGEALRITSEKTIQVPTLGTTATAVVGRNASNELASVTIGSGLSLSAGTLSATGGSSYYQTLRDDGTPATQRGKLNFVGTSTVATTLTDDAGNDETEVALSVPTDGITATQIAADAVGTSEIATDGVGAAEIAADAVGTSEIATDGVGAAEIGASAVGSSEIADGSIIQDDLNQMGATTDQALVWNGSTWAPKTLMSIASPTNITSDQNNYAPTGWSSATTLFVTGDATIRAITGFSALATGVTRTLVNTGTSPIYIPGEHPSSTAANRVDSPVDQILAPNGGAITMVYNGTTSRWFVVNNTFNPAVMASNGVNGHFYNVTVGATNGADWGTVGFATASGGNGTSLASSTIPAGWDINTASSATGASSLYLSKTVANPTEFGSSHMVSSISVNFPTLSDGTQTYTFQFGFIPTPSSTTLAVNNSVAIRYSSGINSGKFEGFSRNNAGTESTVDLGVTVAATTSYLLTVCYDKARTEARFYINGSYAGRVTGSMPNSGSDCGVRAIIVKTAGTTSRSAVIPTFTYYTVYGS